MRLPGDSFRQARPLARSFAFFLAPQKWDCAPTAQKCKTLSALDEHALFHAVDVDADFFGQHAVFRLSLRVDQ